jgi:hypothetical protein
VSQPAYDGLDTVLLSNKYGILSSYGCFLESGNKNIFFSLNKNTLMKCIFSSDQYSGGSLSICIEQAVPNVPFRNGAVLKVGIETQEMEIDNPPARAPAAQLGLASPN